MNYFKKRLSIFLCILVAFTTVCFAAPQEAKAASNVSLGGVVNASYIKEVQVYKGAQNLYAGDFITAYVSSPYKEYGYLSMNSGVTYKSSDKSVATIDSKTGKITTKKNGTTTITVTFKGASGKFKLRVVSKNSIKKAIGSYYLSSLSERESCAKAFLDTTGNITGITSANRYKVLTAYTSYDYKYYNGISSSYDSSSGKSIYYIYCPGESHAYAICTLLSNYAYTRSPFTTSSSKCFRVNSISGKGNSNKITVTLKDKVTEDQIFGGNYLLHFDSEIKKSNKYSFPITVENTKNKYKYYAVATVTKGSNKMTIETRSLKLKKGTTYKLVAQSGDWLRYVKNTFKAN
ncbi:MAG: Ig-like domain-containing protein [Roseburia sp.]